MEAKIEYNRDEGYASLEYGPFSTEIHFNWHRGVIALPQGEITISDYDLGEMLKFRKSESTDLAWDTFDHVLENYVGRKFGSAYIEFLYPGSPGYGLDIKMPYIEYKHYTETDFKNDNTPYYTRSVISSAYRKYRKLVETYNDIMGQLEEEIRGITREVEAISKAEDDSEF